MSAAIACFAVCVLLVVVLIAGMAWLRWARVIAGKSWPW